MNVKYILYSIIQTYQNSTHAVIGQITVVYYAGKPQLENISSVFTLKLFHESSETYFYMVLPV